MLKICVKNVNKTWNTIRKTSEIFSTHIHKSIQNLITMCKKHPFINLLLHKIYTSYSTYIRPFFYLLNKTFTHYPQCLLLKPLNNI